MDERVSLQDLKTFYDKQLVFYNAQPVFVKAINEERVAKVVNLLTQKTLIVENITDIQPFSRRIGNVNIDGGVVIAQREPVRIMQMGVNISNTKVAVVPTTFDSGRVQEDAQRKVMRFDCVEVGLAVMDKYPTIKECIKHNKEFGGGMAFDRQFSITYENIIYYRRKKVGAMPKGCSTVERIEWFAGYHHLAILLGGAHGKDLASFAESCSC